MELCFSAGPSGNFLKEVGIAEAPRLVVRLQHPVARILDWLPIAIVFCYAEGVPETIRELEIRVKE